MQTYSVTLIKTTQQSSTIEVEAESPEEVESIVHNINIEDVDWIENGFNVEIETIEQTSEE